MATALQKQLASIAASSTRELDLKAQRAAHSQSLLFESSEASSQSFDALYYNCCDGFEQLCTLDSRFDRFRRSLFSPQSITEDRTHMTAQENEHLNSLLESFLGLIGSRLLLKPAIKALEWLVRRFRVHEHNTNYLILTFLPYHNTSLFLRLLSILPKTLSSSFRFLHPYMHQRQCPPRAVIVQSAIQDNGFFKSFNTYATKAARSGYHYSLLVSFWASVVVQTVDGKISSTMTGRQDIHRRREDELLTTLLPIIETALLAANAPELVLGTYMIILVLASKVDLQDKVLDSLMVSVVMSFSADTTEPAIGCLAALAERKEQLHIPKPVFAALLHIKNLPQHLAVVGQSQSVQKLVYGLLARLVKMNTNNETQMAIMSALLTDQFLDVARLDTLIALSMDGGLAHVSVPIRQLLAETRTRFADEQQTSSDAMDTEPSQLALEIPIHEDLSPVFAFTTSLEALPHKIEVVSMLCDESTALYVDIHHAFVSAIGSEDHLKSLFRHQIFHQTDDPHFLVALTFCLRAGLSASLSSCRAVAFQTAKQLLSSLSRGNLDLQHLWILSIMALKDENKRVRRAVADFIISLSDYARAIEEDKKDQLVIWGKNSLFGPVLGSPSALTAKSFNALSTVCVLPILDECVSDPAYINEALHEVFDDSSFKSSKRFANLRSSQRTEIYGALCQCASLMPIEGIRTLLLGTAVSVDKCHTHPRTKWLRGVLENAMMYLNGTLEQKTLSLVMRIAHPSDELSILFLLSTLEQPDAATSDIWLSAVFETMSWLWPSLKLARKSLVGQTAMDLITTSPFHSIRSGARRFLGSVDIPSELHLLFLDGILEQNSHEMEPASKRIKMNDSREGQSPESVALMKARISNASFCLDLLQSSRLSAEPAIIYKLMEILKLLSSWKTGGESDSAYLQNMSLSSILALMRDLHERQPTFIPDPKLIQLDLIVDCVCQTSSLEARNAGLQLLALLANMVPQNVLQRIMPVFTLMAGSTARQTDDLSTYVVDKVIQEVIPPLARSMEGRKDALQKSTREIIRHFASAFDHIPSSRRLRLFSLLASSLGVVDSTFEIIAALVEQPGSNVEVGAFAAQVLKQFGSIQYLETMSRYLSLVLTKVHAQPHLVNGGSVEAQGNELDVSNLLSVVPALLSDRDIGAKIRTDIQDAEMAVALRGLFAELLQRTLRLRQIARREDDVVPALGAKVLEGLLKLLPFADFAESAAALFDEPDHELVRSLVRITELQVRSSTTATRAAQMKILKLVPRILRLLETEQDPRLRYSAVACLDQICEKLGNSDRDLIQLVAQSMSSPTCLSSGDKKLSALSLHCLASCVGVLKEEFIPLLQNSVQSALNNISQSLVQPRDAHLHNASFAFLVSLMEYMAFMLPQTAVLAAVQRSHESAVSGLDEVSNQARADFMALVATQLLVRDVCTVVESGWLSALSCGPKALQEHVKLLKSMIEVHGKSSISRDLQACFNVCLRALDFRRERQTERLGQLYTMEQTNMMEQAIIEAFVALVFKTNDAMFRPLFIKLVDWSLEKVGGWARTITLFNLLYVLSERLKSLFTSYFAYVVDSAVQVLRASDETDERFTAVQIVLTSLASSFKFDQDDFWQSPSRYEAVLNPLISMFTFVRLPRYPKDLIDTVVELGAAASSPDNLKQMNSMLLKLFSKDSARVRLAAVQCQQALTERLGEDWLGFLPEMLPSISELQEDDDEKVERETTRWIKMIEGILGESLDTMLQ